MASWRQRVRALEEQLKIKDEIIQTKDNIIQNQGGIISKLEEKIKLLEQHVLHLENKLRKYINENTPSSKKPDWDKKSPDRINKEKKPIGKPKGSNGGTRATPKIDEEKVVRLEEDEAYLGQPIDYVERIVGDIVPISPVKWTRFLLAQYKDPATHDIITATHPDCPPEGTFGPNLRALIALLRERARLSEGQTIEFLEALYDVPVAPATIEAELRRTAEILKPQYNSMKLSAFHVIL